MADVFISYSRRDKDFVETLNKALECSHYDTWIDWDDIEFTEDWWKAIETGIEASHTFIFVISPDSASSQYCRKEAEHAAMHHKRIIPIVRRDICADDVCKTISKLNWLFFRENDDFESVFDRLIETINTDLEHKKTHTRLEATPLMNKGNYVNSLFLANHFILHGLGLPISTI